MTDKSHDTAGVIAPPPLIYGASLLVGLLFHRAFPIALLPRGVAKVVGTVMTGLPVPIIASALMTMNSAGTDVRPHRPTTAIVDTGPFRYTRNPIYVSFTMLYTGIASLVNSLWPMLLLPVVLLVINRGVIDREERYLERKFGEEYTLYKARVRRWI